MIFVFLEVIFRLSGKVSDNFLKQDPVLGWVHLPGKGRSITSEYRVFVEINKFGLVGPETTLEKPRDVFRIAVLGDSVTEAFQVEPKDSYVRRLEKMLNEFAPQPGLRFELLNFGVMSYGTVKQAYILENSVFKFNPDLVILGFFMGNDFSDNLTEKVKPGAEFSGRERLSKGMKLWLRNNSAAWRWFLKKKSSIGFLENQNPPQVEKESSDSEIQATKSALRNFKEIAERHNIPLLILILPSKGLEEEKSILLADFLAKEGIEYFDLLPGFRSWVNMNPGVSAFFPIDSHPNEEGHKIIAEALFEYLKNKLK